MTEINKINVEF